MGALSVSHWLIVFVVLVLLFGPKKLGSLGKSMGEGIRGFRDALRDDEKDDTPVSPPRKSDKKELES